MKKMLLVPAVLLAASILGAAPQTVAVADFQVQSANPRLAFIGKGISELISFELSKSSGISLIEREKRTDMLKELEFSLSDMADADKQLQVGKMLSAKYLVMGEIIDMDTFVLISVRMVDIESGAIVWKDTLSEPLTSYAHISGYFATSILTFMNADVAATTLAASAEQKAGNAEAAIAFSNAIDSYDNKDMAQAKQDLEAARQLDPQNAAVDAYLEKLSPTSPKYKVQLEVFGPSSNPAVLGMIRQDKIYTLASMPQNSTPDEMQPVGDGFSMGEQNLTIRGGVHIPIGERLGLGVEFAFGSFDNKITTPFTFFDIVNDTPSSTYFHNREENYGGVLSLGYRVLDNLSVGIAVHVYADVLIGMGDLPIDTTVGFAGDAGFLLSGWDNTIVFDMHAMMGSQQEYFLDTTTHDMSTDGFPITTEATFTAALFQRKLFLVLKGLGDIYWEKRQGVVIRGIPVAEYWLFPFLSLRGGYQFTWLNLENRSSIGHGFVGGATVRLWTFDIDFNFTMRYQPGRVLPGYGKVESFFLIGVSKNDTLFSR